MTKTANADILSDMKTYTVRDLDREPSAVLDACDAEGAVLIRRRDGRTYALRPERAPQRRAIFPDFAARMRAMGMPKISKRDSDAVDKLIAGE